MRHYCMELIGTFFLTIAIIFVGDPITIGLMLMSMVYIGGHISGGHYNPAVSLGACLRGALKPIEMLWYMGAQTVGAVLAMGLFAMITGNIFSPDVMAEVPRMISVMMEMILTTVLVLMVLTMTTTRRYKNTLVDGAAIGLSLASIAYVGGLFNPAVALASMCGNVVMHGSLPMMENVLVYIGGPCAGSVLAFVVFGYLNPSEK